jgi:N-acetylmuramoyl-L-alanine amidase
LNYKPITRVDFIAIHCTATPEGHDFKAADIDRWHRAKGWLKIGYHFVIDLDGNVEKGRPEDQPGAHVEGFNSRSIGVVYVGGVAADGKTPKDTRTPAQKASLLKLLKELKGRHPSALIQGHYQFPKVAKACPSFDAKAEYAHL